MWQMQEFSNHWHYGKDEDNWHAAMGCNFKALDKAILDAMRESAECGGTVSFPKSPPRLFIGGAAGTEIHVEMQTEWATWKPPKNEGPRMLITAGEGAQVFYMQWKIYREGGAKSQIMLHFGKVENDQITMIGYKEVIESMKSSFGAALIFETQETMKEVRWERFLDVPVQDIEFQVIFNMEGFKQAIEKVENHCTVP